MAGRLKPGVTLAAARADLAVIAAGVDRQNPGRKTTLLVDTATFMNNPEGRVPVLAVGAIILAAVSLVLVVACANLANLLLARAVGRRREIAVRLAVGASRWRLIRQLLTESLLLSAGGGVLGVLAAWGTLRAVVPALLARLPQEVQSVVLNPNPDIRIVLYSLALAFVTGIGFGLVPALQSSNPDLNTALKDSGAGGGRSAGWLRSSLVTAQIAVCLVLLIAAGLLLRGLQAAQSIDPGFQTHGIATAGFDLRLEGYDEPAAAAFHSQLAARLAVRPGIAEVAFVDSVPLSGSRRGTCVTLEGRQVQPTDHRCDGLAELLPATRNSGGARPRRSTRARAVRNSTSSWSASLPRASSGRERIRSANGYELATTSFITRWWGWRRTSAQPAWRAWIRSFSTLQWGRGRITVFRCWPAAAAATEPSQRRFAKRRRRWTRTCSCRPARSKATSRCSNSRLEFFPILASVLGLAGLLLAALGIYGVMAYAVTQRTREIGIRMTMGAQRRDVMQLILAQAMRPVVIGVAIGLAASAGVSRVLASLLYGVSPLDPGVFAGVALFLSAVALLASYAPAQRAARVDPMISLRHS